MADKSDADFETLAERLGSTTRIPEADRAAFDTLMRQTGKRESELVREAVHLLLEQHKPAT